MNRRRGSAAQVPLDSRSMRRNAVLLAVLFSMLCTMLWQSVAVARPGSTVNVVADLEHAALHWWNQGHHHHEDGSFHLDDSQASKLHAMSDPVTATIALLPAVSHRLEPGASSPPGGLQDARVPAPFLDGLLRPPRFRA